MTEQPEWTPEQQEIINYSASLDMVSKAFSLYMMETCNLSFATIGKLLPLAEIAWRDKDPKGVLVFHNIDTPNPRVEYTANPIKIALYRYGRNVSNRCMVPLETILWILTRQAKGVQ
jgi:hypothetical protein